MRWSAPTPPPAAPRHGTPRQFPARGRSPGSPAPPARCASRLMEKATRRSAPTPSAAASSWHSRGNSPARRAHRGLLRLQLPLRGGRCERQRVRQLQPRRRRGRRARAGTGETRRGTRVDGISCVAGPLCVAVDEAGDALASSEPAGAWVAAPDRQLAPRRCFLRLRTGRCVRGRGREPAPRWRAGTPAPAVTATWSCDPARR